MGKFVYRDLDTGKNRKGSDGKDLILEVSNETSEKLNSIFTNRNIPILLLFIGAVLLILVIVFPELIEGIWYGGGEEETDFISQ